jgi:hypothetical protein
MRKIGRRAAMAAKMGKMQKTKENHRKMLVF